MDKKLFVATQEGPLEQLAHQVDLCWESLENLTTITLHHHDNMAFSTSYQILWQNLLPLQKMICNEKFWK